PLPSICSPTARRQAMKKLLEAVSRTGSDGRGARGHPRLLLAAGASALVMVAGAVAQESPRGAVEHFIGTVVRQTATVCPLASPSDQAALDSCRRALYLDSACRQRPPPAGAPGPTDSRRPNAPGNDPDAVQTRRDIRAVHADVHVSRGVRGQ